MSRSNYYEMRDAKVRIAHELMNRGWEVIGYKPNESDSMTDYYSPANWGGIATKNGFVLCVDTPYSAESKPIIKYNYGACLSHSDIEKIKKLEAMTIERGATEGEEANAKAMIEKIKSNTSDKPTEEITGYTVAHMANPGKCKWHIEKDGSLYDKGTGITKYSEVPDEYRFDINTMQYKESYKYYTTWENGEPVRKENTITDEERKVINDFKSLILRWERIVNNMNGMYDGTAENKKEAEQQAQNEKMTKVTKKVTKTVLKMVEVTDRKNIQVGDYITAANHGHYWKVTREYMQKGTWKGVTESRKAFVYEIVGSASRGYQSLKNPKSYYNYEFRMLKDIEAGTTKIFELKEVEEVTEVERWIKTESIHKEIKKETKENTKNETVIEVNNSEAVTEPATKKQLWALHVATKLDTRELKISKTLASELITKSISGTDITAEVKKLMGIEEVQQQEENPYKPEFKEGYVYNVHFKEWNLSITEIKEALTKLGLQYKMVDMSNKIDLVGLTYTEAMQVEELNNKNGSILFKDVELTEEEFNITESLIDYSTSLICELELFKTEWSSNEEFKTRFMEYIKAKNITIITSNTIQYLENINFNELVKVLKDLCQPQESINANNNTENKKQDNSKLMEKINSQIKTNNKKIEHLNGDYKTNTWKRMKEQEGRDRQKAGLEYDNRILNYLLDKAQDNTITEFEKCLITGTLRNDIDLYCKRHFTEKKTTTWTEIEYPQIRKEWGLDNWYNKEVPTKQKRLNKAGIYNTTDLIKAVKQYKIVIEEIEKNNTSDPVKEKIKKLTREYRMNQKGDFHCTENKELLNRLMELADIQNSDKVLEPSAGLGHIADKLKEYTNNVDVCEYMNSYAELLQLKGYNVKANDFLSYNNYNSYDKIVANVPFSDEINHIKHMYKMLKGEGRIVVITSPHWTFANDKQSKEFREWLNSLTHEVIDIPSGQFEFTNVPVKILTIDKNINTDKVAM